MKTKKVVVRVVRLVAQSRDIDMEVPVHASNTDIEELALGKAGDIDFSGTEKDADYKVDSIRVIGQGGL